MEPSPLIVDLRAVDAARPDPPGEYALQITAALVRVTPHLTVTVLEPGYQGTVPAFGTLLTPAGGTPRPGRRCITALHEVAGLERPLAGLADRFRAAFVLNRSERVLVPSTFAAEALGRHLRAGPAKVQVVLPGVEPAFRRSSREEAARLRRELGLPERYLLAYGDQDLAVRAFAAAHVPSGAGLIDAERLSPTRDQLAPLLSGATGALFCQPRASGAMRALQAMACGTPPVVPADGAFPEVVRDGGLTIPLPTSPSRSGAGLRAWTDAISALYRSDALRTQLSRRGRELAAQLTAERAARAVAGLL